MKYLITLFLVVVGVFVPGYLLRENMALHEENGQLLQDVYHLEGQLGTARSALSETNAQVEVLSAEQVMKAEEIARLVADLDTRTTERDVCRLDAATQAESLGAEILRLQTELAAAAMSPPAGLPAAMAPLPAPTPAPPGDAPAAVGGAPGGEPRPDIAWSTLDTEQRLTALVAMCVLLLAGWMIGTLLYPRLFG